MVLGASGIFILAKKQKRKELTPLHLCVFAKKKNFLETE